MSKAFNKHIENQTERLDAVRDSLDLFLDFKGSQKKEDEAEASSEMATIAMNRGRIMNRLIDADCEHERIISENYPEILIDSKFFSH